MDNRLHALRQRRAQVLAEIEKEYARPYPDALHLGRLKRLRLWLKERIAVREALAAPRPVRAPAGFASSL